MGLENDTRGAFAHAVEHGRSSDHLAWCHALAIADAVRVLHGDRRVDALRRAADLSPWTRQVVARRVTAIEWLAKHDLALVSREPLLPIGLVTAIVFHRRGDDAAKAVLVADLHRAASSGSAPIARAKLLAHFDGSFESDPPGDWRRSGDRWHFPRREAGLGSSKQPFALAGQAALNLVERFRPEGGLVVSACCGSGVVMDACGLLGIESYLGFDLRCDERVAERHAPRFRQFDATRTDWTPVCAAGTAGLVIVTAPPFTFGKSAETDASTDLGRFIDPEEWLGAMACVIAGATRTLAVGSVIAVTVRQTAEFEHGAPVPDLRFEVGKLLAEAGFEIFLGNPVVTVGRAKRAEHSGAWVVPEVVQIVVMRKS